MDEGRLRLLEDRLSRAELKISSLRNDISWLSALVFVGPMLAVIIATSWQ